MKIKKFAFDKNYSFFTVVIIVIAAFIYALSLNSFGHHAHLYPGGLTALTLLIQRVSLRFFGLDLPFFPINIALNIIPAILSYKFVGKKFTLYSVLAIGLISLFIQLIPYIPMNYDRLIATIYGGIFNGISLVLLLHFNVSSGGTDFVSMAISNKYKISIWNYVFLFNATILLISGLLFSFDDVLYSIIFQFVSTQILNYFYHRYKKVTVLIVSDIAEEIGNHLLNVTRHGISVFDGKGMYTGQKRQLIYTVVSLSQVKLIVKEAQAIDACCFVNVIKSEAVYGLFSEVPFE